jgi:hypothetical protein
MTEYLTKEQISLILKGEYKADFIEAFGIIHYHYEDCDEKDLVQTQKSGVRVHYKCKEAFDKMHETALKEGIELEIISAYRSSKCQIEIFKHKFKDKEIIAKAGDKIEIDEICIEFLYSYKGGMYANLMNDASLVFKVITPKTSVLFLGDLGPDGGDELKKIGKEKLKADYVQMAHHGHMCVEKSVYELINPRFCLWTAPLWLYNEPKIPDYLSDRQWHKKVGRDRMWGTALTRKWMEELGVKKHYVSGEGTQILEI